MGMYNAIIDDEFLNPLGVFKERLSQSALVARMSKMDDDAARAVTQWLEKVCD
jgi:L-fucose isomerase-like protein